MAEHDRGRTSSLSLFSRKKGDKKEKTSAKQQKGLCLLKTELCLLSFEEEKHGVNLKICYVVIFVEKLLISFESRKRCD